MTPQGARRGAAGVLASPFGSRSLHAPRARDRPPQLVRAGRLGGTDGGVCGGLARYWNTDPTLLRILTVVLTLATGGAFLRAVGNAQRRSNQR